MKKNYVFISSLLVAFCLAGCSNSSGGDTTGGTSGSSQKGMITVKLDDTYKSKIKNGYFPSQDNIYQLEGTIDINMDFEGGVQKGWQAVAKEYERLQSNKVKVNIHSDLTGTQYSDKLNTELKNADTEWDIIEGNLGYSNTQTYCIDLGAYINGENAYCGADEDDGSVNTWSSVLQSVAYKDFESDTSDTAYILNSENMQSCWFVNDIALQAAKDQGYEVKDENGNAMCPRTWNELISLCVAMEKAGYTNPLGISLCDISIRSLQFTWLLRIYGDYYYRSMYRYIMKVKPEETPWANYDPTNKNIETAKGYSIAYPKMLSILFDNDSANVYKEGPGYMGYESELYKDFVTNMQKMKGHLIKDTQRIEFSELRDSFYNQSLGKVSPQIILDYQGFGIRYEQRNDETFKVKYFDYPVMEPCAQNGLFKSGPLRDQKMIPDGTITRDIGGNGGFISVINHAGNKNQNQLNTDFVKFMMSPYGQIIYYNALAENDAYPKGLTTLKDGMIEIPTKWKEFFKKSGESGITYNGNIDANPFISWGVRYVGGRQATESIICSNWRGLLLPDNIIGSGKLTVDAFASKWATACLTDSKAAAKDMNWNDQVWTNPYYNM